MTFFKAWIKTVGGSLMASKISPYRHSPTSSQLIKVLSLVISSQQSLPKTSHWLKQSWTPHTAHRKIVTHVPLQTVGGGITWQNAPIKWYQNKFPACRKRECQQQSFPWYAGYLCAGHFSYFICRERPCKTPCTSTPEWYTPDTGYHHLCESKAQDCTRCFKGQDSTSELAALSHPPSYTLWQQQPCKCHHFP